jgi:hypothetical protein
LPLFGAAGASGSSWNALRLENAPLVSVLRALLGAGGRLLPHPPLRHSGCARPLPGEPAVFRPDCVEICSLLGTGLLPVAMALASMRLKDLTFGKLAQVRKPLASARLPASYGGALVRFPCSSAPAGTGKPRRPRRGGWALAPAARQLGLSGEHFGGCAHAAAVAFARAMQVAKSEMTMAKYNTWLDGQISGYYTKYVRSQAVFTGGGCSAGARADCQRVCVLRVLRVPAATGQGWQDRSVLPRHGRLVAAVFRCHVPVRSR